MGKLLDFLRNKARDQLGNEVSVARYVVEAGDTLQAIASAHGMSCDELKQLNRIHKPKHEKKKLVPGKKLKVFEHTLRHSQSFTVATLGTTTRSVSRSSAISSASRANANANARTSASGGANGHGDDELLYYDSQEEWDQQERESALSFSSEVNFLRPHDFDVNVIDDAAPRSKASQFLKRILKRRTSKLNSSTNHHTPSAREQAIRASCVEFDHCTDFDDDQESVINMHRALSEMSVPTKGHLDDISFPELLGATKKEILSHPKLSKKLVTQIENCLPHAYRGYDWKLVFSCLQHGSNLDTMLTKLRNHHGSLVLVETAGGEVFGGFNAVAWKRQPSYYGSGQSFVFSCLPKFEFFIWSRANSMFMMSNSQNIAMGGGGDGFAWCLNSDLTQGTSNCSQTFNNKVFTSSGQYDVVHIEAWIFMPKRFTKK